MSRRRSGPLATLALLSLLSTAGCSSDAPTPRPLTSSTPSTAPTPPPSQSASPATSPAPPTLPAAVHGHTDASAQAFVRYWVAALDYGALTGNAKILRSASSPQCPACIAIADYIDRVHQSRGRIRGKGWAIVSSRVVKTMGRGGRIVDATVIVHPQVIAEKPGAKLLRYSGGRRHKKFWLARRARTWTITYLEQPE